MNNDFLAITDGMYIFSETKENNVFYFWRRDGLELREEDVKEKFPEMYNSYLIVQIQSRKIKAKAIISNIRIDVLKDRKIARMTVF